MTKERRDQLALFHRQIDFLLTKKEQIVRKTYERISNPDPNSLTQRKKSLCFAEFKTVGIFAISLSFLKTFLDFFTRALLFYKQFFLKSQRSL